jgi:hypothetical protein
MAARTLKPSRHRVVSAPRQSTIPINWYRHADRAGVAQLAERQPSKLNVASSNLVSRSSVHRHGRAEGERDLTHQSVTGTACAPAATAASTTAP